MSMVTPSARASTTAGSPKAGWVGEVVLDVENREARGHGDAVPLVETVDGDVVAGLLEGGGGELVGAALDFLHGEHVRV